MEFGISRVGVSVSVAAAGLEFQRGAVSSGALPLDNLLQRCFLMNIFNIQQILAVTTG